MIHFGAVDFSERRSKEVVNFFWRLVYDKTQQCMQSLLFMYLSLPVYIFYHDK